MTLVLESAVALREVFDMPRSVAFYRDVLDFEVAATSGQESLEEVGWALLRNGDAELMLNTQYEPPHRPEAPNPDRTAAHANTCLFLACRDLDAAYAHLRGKVLDVAPPVVRPYGMRQLAVSDPDGYGICLQWRAP